MAFYRTMSDEPGMPPIGSRDYQFVVGVYEDVLRSPLSPVVGHDPGRDPDDNWPPPSAITALGLKPRIYYRGEIRPAGPGEEEGLEVAAIWDLADLIERLVGEITATEADRPEALASGPFDNDFAADWCRELDDAPKRQRESIIRNALTTAINDAEYLDVDEGSHAMAAAAVIAAQRPNSQLDMTQAPQFVVTGERLDLPADVASLALQALAKVESEESELRGLWVESGHLDDWLAAVASIRTELRRGS